MMASCRLQTTPPETCATFLLSVSLLRNRVFQPQLLWIHTLSNFASLTPLESTLTKSPARVSKHASLTPVESALTESGLPSPLESALTKNRGVGGGACIVRQQVA